MSGCAVDDCFLPHWAKGLCKPHYDRQWWASNCEHIRRYNLKRAYGLELEEYNQLLEEQGGVCAICGEPESRGNQYGLYSLGVDHDHDTGLVRGLLCTNCNQGLGLLGDSIERIEKTLQYLKRATLRLGAHTNKEVA